MEEENKDFLEMVLVSFIFTLLAGISLLVTEEEIAAFTGRLF